MISDAYIDSCNRLLGCMLNDKQAAAEIILKMSEQDFIIDEHRLIFNTATKLFNSDVDITPQTVGGKTSDDIFKICKSMVELTPSSVEWSGVWELIKNAAKIERANAYIDEIKVDASNMATDIEILRGKAENLVGILNDETDKDTHDYNALQVDYIQNIEKPRQFVDFGINKLTKTARCPKNGLVVIAARPSVGKTAFALQLAKHISLSERVGFFSFETDRRTIMDRLNAGSAGIPMQKLQDGNLTPLEYEHLIKAARKKRDLKIYEVSGNTPEQIRSKVIRDRLDVIIVDYMQLVQNSNRKYGEYERVTYTSTFFKSIATDLNVTVIALSQLNRNITQYQEPELSDLRSTGQIEQDANVVLFLYIPDDDDLKNNIDRGNQDLLRWCKIAKAKEGITGKFKMYFDGQYQRFTEGWDYFVEVESEFDEVIQQTFGTGA